MTAQSIGMLVPLALTLIAYRLACELHQRSGRHLLLHPLGVTISLIILVLLVTRTPYETYFKGAQLIHFLLGPVVVALAVPLYRQRARVANAPALVLVSIAAGACVATSMVILAAWVLRADVSTVASLAPKSATAPIAFGLAQSIGAIPPLSAAFAILTGIIGAALGPLLLDKLGVRDQTARGLALGTASHGIGTARALEDGEQAGAFAGLAMGLTALALSITIPLAFRLF